LDGLYQEHWHGRTIVYHPFTAVLHPEGFKHRDEIGHRGARFFTVEISNDAFRQLGAEVPSDVICDQSAGPLVRAATRLLFSQNLGDESALAVDEFLADAVALRTPV